MALRFLGRESQVGNSPTLWADGQHYVIQGFIPDDATRAEIGSISANEAVVRVPKKLMEHLSKDSDDSPRL